jgi:hypothetical protein
MELKKVKSGSVLTFKESFSERELPIVGHGSETKLEDE